MTQKLEWKIAAALRHTGHVTVDQAGECAEAVMALMIAAQSEPATRAVPVAILDKPAQVGGGIFRAGIKWSTVIGAAQRHFEHMQPPENEAERIAKARKFADIVRGIAAPTPDAERHVANHAGDGDAQAAVAPDWKAEEAAFDAYMNEPCALGSPVSRRNMYRNGTAVARVRDGWMLRARLAAPAEPTEQPVTNSEKTMSDLQILESAADATMCPEERELFDKFDADTKQRFLNQILKRAAQPTEPK